MTDLKHSPEAVAIGRALAKSPPQHYQDCFSAEGWATIADAVLDASQLRGTVSALREIARMEPDPNEGVRPLDDLIDRMKGEAERALDRLNCQIPQISTRC